MARVPIPPVKLPWREKDIQSGDHKLLADYLKVLIKTLQKKLEEIGNIVNVNADKMGDMLKDDYDPDNDGKVESADHADTATNADHATTADSATNADHATTADSATNADKVDNYDTSQTPQANVIPVSNSEGYLKNWIRLNDIENVTISNPTDGQVLAYQDGSWTNIDGGSSAENISYDNTTSGLTATNVQNAIDEVDNEIDKIKNGTTTVGNADHANNADNATNADKLNNQNSSYYTNASNLNAGIVPRARLDGTYDIDITGDAQTLQGKSPSDFASSTHTHSLGDLSNVTILSPTNGQVLGYQDGTWKNIDGGGGTYYVCPEDYGAWGDGSHDDSTAIQNMFDAIMNDQTDKKYCVFLPRIYKITRSITVNLNHALTLKGAGINVGGFKFSGSLSNDYGFKFYLGNHYHLTLENLSFLADFTGQYTAVIIEESSTNAANDRTKNRFVIDKVRVAGASAVTNSGWYNGIYIKDAQNGHFFGYTFEGYSSNGATPNSGNAITIEGSKTGMPTQFQIGHTNIFYAQQGIYILGHVEGVYLHESNLVAVNYGVYANNTFAHDTTNPKPHMPQINVINNHIAFRNCGVYLYSISQSNVSHNLLYSRGDATGVLVAIQLDETIISRVESNIIVKINDDQNFNGIVCSSQHPDDPDSLTNSIYIGSNTFQGNAPYTGIWLQQGTGNNMVVEPENKHIWAGTFTYKILDER